MKNNVIKICIILGAVSIVLIIFGVLVLLLTNWCIKSLLFDLCLAIGSGLLCSAIVSYFIERSNNKLLDNLHSEQRKFVLNNFQSDMESLLKIEYKALQNCILLDCIDQPLKESEQQGTILELTTKIYNLLENILKGYENQDIIKKPQIKDIYICHLQEVYAYSESINYYRTLYKRIGDILTNSPTYLVSDILTQNQIEQLQSLNKAIQDVANIDSCRNFEYLFAQKIAFFKILSNSKDILSLFVNDISYVELARKDSDNKVQ